MIELASARFLVVGAVCAAVFRTIVAAGQTPQPTGSSVWDGVYSDAQAARGGTVYLARCGRCHGESSANQQNPLWGDRFAEHWESRTLADLFQKIRDTMPPGVDARAVEAADKLDVVAFLLQQNGFPAGPAVLTATDAALAAIRITGKDGPAPIRTGTVVRVAGCLARRNEREWQLTEATEPERTTLPPPGGATATPPSNTGGTNTISLMNPFPSPAAHEGHRMMVAGFLIKRPDGDAVNVVSMQLMAPSCLP